MDYPDTQPLSTIPQSRSKDELQTVDTRSTEFYHQPSVASLGGSSALGGAAAIVAVTAAAIPLIHHSHLVNNKIYPSSSNRDIPGKLSVSSESSSRLDGGSTLTNGREI